MPEPRARRALICDRDRWSMRATAEVVEAAGFEIIGEAENAVEALRLNELLRPALIVITNEQTGMSGLEAIPELFAVDDPPEIVLLSMDDSARDTAKFSGAYELALVGDTPMLERMLAEIGEILDTGERRSSNDRRSGEDRRQKQDWSKVTTERRSGTDRRRSMRREQDVATAAKDALRRPPPDEAS